MNSRAARFRHNHCAPLANGNGSVQRGRNEMQRIADQRPEASLQRRTRSETGTR
jgi:hypothetical protein